MATLHVEQTINQETLSLTIISLQSYWLVKYSKRIQYMQRQVIYIINPGLCAGRCKASKLYPQVSACYIKTIRSYCDLKQQPRFHTMCTFVSAILEKTSTVNNVAGFKSICMKNSTHNKDVKQYLLVQTVLLSIA